jgi:hypothetical protein
MSGVESFAGKYFEALVNKFFKILPMRETNEPTLGAYLDSLYMELSGDASVFVEINYDPSFVTLMSISCSLRNNPSIDVQVVKREVFRAITICKQLASRYRGGDSGGCD